MTRATIIAGIRMTNITQGGACKEKKEKRKKEDKILQLLQLYKPVST